MIEASALVSFLVYIIVIGLVFYLLWWLLAQVGLPEPFNRVARIVLAVVAVLVLINLLLSLVGTPIVKWR
jgi:hypothetical protein